jgi:hypothetical protein
VSGRGRPLGGDDHRVAVDGDHGAASELRQIARTGREPEPDLSGRDVAARELDGGPCATSSPSRITATRSASACASSMK